MSTHSTDIEEATQATVITMSITIQAMRHELIETSNDNTRLSRINYEQKEEIKKANEKYKHLCTKMDNEYLTIIRKQGLKADMRDAKIIELKSSIKDLEGIAKAQDGTIKTQKKIIKQLKKQVKNK